MRIVSNMKPQRSVIMSEIRREKTPETINERLKMFASVKGLSQRRLANLLDMSTSSISLLMTGKTKPSDQTKARIVDRLGVSSEWLEHGTGKMYNENSEEGRLEAAFKGFISHYKQDYRKNHAVAAKGCLLLEILEMPDDDAYNIVASMRNAGELFTSVTKTTRDNAKIPYHVSFTVKGLSKSDDNDN